MHSSRRTCAAFPATGTSNCRTTTARAKAIDASVGRVRKVLDEEGLAENTIFVFMSDHGCHFMTRNQEYKRSTHNSSLRVPLLIRGPGFENARQIRRLVGIIDIAPTLLDAAGVPVPASMKGRSILPSAARCEGAGEWPNRELIQISESMTGRAIRTKDWTYCVADPTGATDKPASTNYHEYQLYDQRNDPHELVNLAGQERVPCDCGWAARATERVDGAGGRRRSRRLCRRSCTRRRCRLPVLRLWHVRRRGFDWD